MGMINAGTAVGAVVAPPAIAAILGVAGWRWVFFLSGAAGLVWTMVWARRYAAPPDDQGVATRGQGEQSDIAWVRLLGFPQVWGLVAGKFLSDAAWFFYLFW